MEMNGNQKQSFSRKGRFLNIGGQEMSFVKRFWAIPVPNMMGEAQGTVWDGFRSLKHTASHPSRKKNNNCRRKNILLGTILHLPVIKCLSVLPIEVFVPVDAMLPAERQNGDKSEWRHV